MTVQQIQSLEFQLDGGFFWERWRLAGEFRFSVSD
jgi:hypothetical protein